ncbi:MAG TPA: RNA polymerase sigma factor, partial [Isosphaeraceae bacterium]|nr:RNA polymerase sigma factor [Isosphaeraceae bacterium]
MRRFRTLFVEGAVGGLSDGQLLGRFAGRRGVEAEAPFAALVERHGPMVLRACRAILRDEHEAQDAFQATFLVLARKARSLWVRDSLGPWLHQVACRTAAAARSAAGRRRALERRAAEMARSSDDRWQMPPDDDLGPALHEEVNRLPDRYRRPLVLCYLEGLTHDEAARQLDWPVGTVRSRLSRGRERLKGRLLRRGLAPATVLGLAASSARAEVSTALLESTVRAATHFAAGHATAAGLVSATAVALSEGVLRTMFLAKFKLLAAGLVAAGLLATGTAAVARRDGDDPKSQPAKATEAKEKGDEGKSPQETLDRFLYRLRLAQAQFQTQRAKVDQLTAELDDENAELKVLEARVSILREQYRVATGRVRQDESKGDGPGPAKPPAAEEKKDLTRMYLAQHLREARATAAVFEARLREHDQMLRPKPGGANTPDRPGANKAEPPGAAEDSGPGPQPKGEGGGPREKRSYQQLQPTLYFAASATGEKAAVYDIETRKAKSVRLTESKEAKLQVVPIRAPNMVPLLLKGPKIVRLAVFTFPDFEWHTHDLPEPFEGEASPIAGMRVTAYILGRRVYAFSVATMTWDVLDVPPGAPLTPRVQADSVVLEFEGQLHEFQANSGRWGVHPSVQTILDGILDQDDP